MRRSGLHGRSLTTPTHTRMGNKAEQTRADQSRLEQTRADLSRLATLVAAFVVNSRANSQLRKPRAQLQESALLLLMILLLLLGLGP